MRREARLEIFKEGDPKWYEDSVDFIVHKQGSAATSSDYQLARTPDGGVIIEQATPPGISMQMVQRLNERDLKMLAIDRNVPEAVRLAARKFTRPK